MRYTLKDYQSDAAAAMLERLTDARDDVTRARPRNVSFSLAATTGAGKTVIATAVLESLFFGNPDLDFEADPTAVVLWLTDAPELNKQTQTRIFSASNKLGRKNVEIVNNSFHQEKLAPRRVYFLNTQLLSKNSSLVRGAIPSAPGQEKLPMPETRQYTFWDTLRNTIEDKNLTLYLVLDEAHRGMRVNARERKAKPTIVNQLINGAYGAPPVPVVWGISATIDRFTDAMSQAQNRVQYPNYQVSAERIQDSGLLKDSIRLSFPAEHERGTVDTALLAHGLRRLKHIDRLWRDYAASQAGGQDTVVPLLVVQMPNTPSQGLLDETVRTIYEAWPELPGHAVSHVFGDRATFTAGGRQISYEEPQRIQDFTNIRVVLAKDAISTGWDCPRAEVLVSFRPAEDKTHITQLLGRMVRTPLARRVSGHDALNSVECILPLFNRKTATEVAYLLSGDASSDTGTAGPEVFTHPVELTANPAVQEEVWEVLEQLPSHTLPQTAPKPVVRMLTLGIELAKDGIAIEARAEALEDLRLVITGELPKNRHRMELDLARKQLSAVHGETIIVQTGTHLHAEGEAFQTAVNTRALERDLKFADRMFTRELRTHFVKQAVKDLTPEELEDFDELDLEVELASAAKVPAIVDMVEAEAARATERWLDQYRVAIKGLPERRQAVYDEIRAMTEDPQRSTVVRPQVRIEESVHPETGESVPTRPGHLMSDSQGQYPVAKLKGWETSVLDTESTRDSFVAWYRNPDRGSKDALAVAYRDANNDWRRLHPDFVFFHNVADTIRASLVDPHGFHLADAVPKLRGLANYAEEYGDEFHRIESIVELNGVMRGIDLKDPSVREAIGGAYDAESLYRGDFAFNYQ